MQTIEVLNVMENIFINSDDCSASILIHREKYLGYIILVNGT